MVRIREARAGDLSALRRIELAAATLPRGRDGGARRPAPASRATGAVATDAPPPDEPLDRATLTAIARSYGIEFLGPPPAL